MDRSDYLAFHRTICNTARTLSERKNHDYAGDNGERPFANFERVESMGVCSTERGFLVRIVDKVSRLSSFCQSGSFAVSDESFSDTVMDAINYLVLLAAYHHAKQERQPDP